MGKIKFRAWDFENNKMFRIVNINFQFNGCINWVEDINGNKYRNLGNIKGVDCSRLMQYTGLKDNNGKEIYEGDIVRNFDGDIFDIYSSEGSFLADSDEFGYGEGYLLSELDCEIIGNKYENQNSFDSPKP